MDYGAMTGAQLKHRIAEGDHRAMDLVVAAQTRTDRRLASYAAMPTAVDRAQAMVDRSMTVPRALQVQDRVREIVQGPAALRTQSRLSEQLRTAIDGPASVRRMYEDHSHRFAHSLIEPLSEPKVEPPQQLRQLVTAAELDCKERRAREEAEARRFEDLIRHVAELHAGFQRMEGRDERSAAIRRLTLAIAFLSMVLALVAVLN